METATPLMLISSFTELPATKQAVFINEWALYLKNLGRLTAAARCYELQIEMRMRQENWRPSCCAQSSTARSNCDTTNP